MKKTIIPVALAVAFGLGASLLHAESKPLKALLVAGGCCHDYAKQHDILSKGIQARANVQVDVVWTDDKSVNPPLSLYDNPDWAKGYDIIIHDECAAGAKDLGLVKRILDVHQTIPAVHLHCAMHSFRTGTDAWFKHLGIQSSSHGPQEPIAISFVDKEHPIIKTLSDWSTIKEELYNNVNVLDAHALAMGRQTIKNKDGTTRDETSIVVWTNEKQGARSFSTTLGHNNDTVADARYLELVTRGLLWACDKLSPDYLIPFKGENKVTFVAAPKAEPAKQPAPRKDALPVKATASSEEAGKNNFAWMAVDGDVNTRWCAGSSEKPQQLNLIFEKPQDLTGIKIVWESPNNAYQHKVEVTNELAKARDIVADATKDAKPGDSEHSFKASKVKLVIITCTGTSQGGWASIREVSFQGPGIKSDTGAGASAKKSTEAAPKAAAKPAYDKASDPLKDAGNIEPKIVKLTPEEEAAILKDVKVADGFEVTLFANSTGANYPVYVAAAPDGTLYVSSDGNGSLGRNPKRGRIIRLRDTDGDGRADETKVFCEVDSPRGLVWDHDRLYLVHPPHLSAFIDKDGDGVSDEQKILVKDIAFGFKDRPADHTTNGLSLGIDGWLYIAGGDFGFMKAEGTDGKTLQHRGGGVIRVRPDGTGLEVYSTGTRNILEVAISPLMDIFARDNTNDGGGWNVRFHHFTGLDDHGYPRFYKNFNDECIQPLADYGGGSGCGAVYIDEPGFGAWNNAPFTADWGTGALWHHHVKAKGATFEETRAPEPFIKMTRPTDADVDAMSRVYCCSWRGATFNWEGPDVGYIVQVKPKGFKAEPLPDFAKATDAELAKLLESPSNRRRMEAQRQLVTRILSNHQLSDACGYALNQIIGEAATDKPFVPSKAPPSAKAAVIFAKALSNKGRFVHTFEKLARNDPEVSDIYWRAALAHEAPAAEQFDVFEGESLLEWPKPENASPRTRMAMTRAFSVGAFSPMTMISGEKVSSLIDEALADDETKLQVICSLQAAALRFEGKKGRYLMWDDEMPAEGFTIIEALLHSIDSVHDPKIAVRALMVLRGVHTAKVAAGLIERLGKATDPMLRQNILAALCRLHFKEGEWKGDSWGTRPDTRGPYYQPEEWSETPKIEAALKEALAKAQPEEAAFLIKEMTRNRIQSNDALNRILELAKQDAKVIPDLVAQLATADTIPADAVPLLIGAAQKSDTLSPGALANTITAITKTDSAEAWVAALGALVALDKVKDSNKDQEAGRTAFLSAPKLENVHQALEAEAEKVGTPTGGWAEAAVLTLAARTTGSPESREMSQKALDAGWTDARRRVQIIRAAEKTKSHALDEKILAAISDPDKAVAGAARSAVNSLKIKPKEEDKTPKISTLKPEEVIAAVLDMKGDVTLGEQLFTKATCIACHTTKESEAQKGPYLGNIAQTYKRPDMAQNILDPNKTIAQGFASEMVTLKDGTVQMGFITLEGAKEIKIRNIAAQEFTYKTADITKRDKLPVSMMPPMLMNNFTVKEFASLLDYLEALSKK